MKRKIISKYYQTRIEQGFVLRLECNHTVFVKWGNPDTFKNKNAKCIYCKLDYLPGEHTKKRLDNKKDL
jgi:hypothetical protein